ncbi:MAG: glycoside hydrolase family 2 TIM barrel-domain containing protein [Chitinophagaceae bacterium]
MAKGPLFLLLVCFCFNAQLLSAQNITELNAGWICAKAADLKMKGNEISMPSTPLTNWQPAVVPGTVLTTMLANKQIPDPFYGMNNQLIPDIFKTGKEYYTYWFIKDFKETFPANGEQVWLNLRGVNYGCDVYINGHLLNATTHKGMFLRQRYNISTFLQKNGNNRLAIIVYPPDVTGNANGGQGGDGTIARNVSLQYVAGWDWIQPIRDRNTGIWDKVLIEKTNQVNIINPHIITEVPGVRIPNAKQAPAIIKLSAELENAAIKPVSGVLSYQLEGKTISKKVVLPASATQLVQLDDLTLPNPKLWWPSGYGAQDLYNLNLRFTINGSTVSDEEKISFGIREIKSVWNNDTRSAQVMVNGQKIFIKGGNWIISDAMLRFSPERYDAEIRFHRDMNLNLIRIWGGAITERPEFYEACDKYGILVMQDFWGSGDCNGRWQDPMKLDDQWTRRNYPDDHNLFLTSAADQIKMLRNYASLAIWCGGNEITLPGDIFHPLKDSILPALDGTRWFIDYSNSDSMSYNFLGGNGDGPYGIQNTKTFFAHRTYPFNSEIGSVGTGDYESLERFMPEANRVVPTDRRGPEDVMDSVWNYHKYISYGHSLQPYGAPKDIKDFTEKAQLVNYDQYRALMEGFSAHMWEWYTGVIIWKTQNPWTALRGQMYDYYLDPNACLYGLHKGSEPLHILLNPADSMVMVVNNTFETHRDMMLQVKLFDMKGKETNVTEVFSEIGPTLSKKYLGIQRELKRIAANEGAFVLLRLVSTKKEIISENLYWMPDSTGNYSGLQKMDKSNATTNAKQIAKNKIAVTVTNPAQAPVAFFNRISLLDQQTHKRILPCFYSDNYISVLPGESKTITVDYPASNTMPVVEIRGWNQQAQMVTVQP